MNFFNDWKEKKALSERYFIRAADFNESFESFFVSAIVAILAIRIFLGLTNYPQLGGRGLHIAHMLWGGALMLISTSLLLTFLSRSTRRIASVIAGLGFGTFIDELGKFVTSDNNYFFRPTFSLIYVIFVLLYLIFYSLKKFWPLTPKEYLINSLEYIKDAVIEDLDTEEKKLAIKYLDHSDGESQITPIIQNLYQKLETIPTPKPNIFTRVKKSLRNFYFQIVKKEWFVKVINSFFILDFVTSLLSIIASVIAVLIMILPDGITLRELAENNIALLNLFAHILAGIFVISGTKKMRHSRLEAYKMFKKATLVAIFLIQILSFYQQQLRAFVGLLFNILILITLNYMIEQEKITSSEDKVLV